MDLFSLGTTFNFSPVSVVSAFLLIIISILYLKLQSKTPGPWGLPYLGYWPLLKDETAHLKLQEFMKKYGDVYSLTYAGKLYIHLGSLKSVKEALITKSNNFTERFSGFSLITSLFNEGIYEWCVERSWENKCIFDVWKCKLILHVKFYILLKILTVNIDKYFKIF